MKTFLGWWYSFSLPRREPDRTPAERERTRYAHLTTGFTLLIFILATLLTPWSFIKYTNPAAPLIAGLGFLVVVAALVFNKLGLNFVAASMIVSSTIINVMGNMITTPLDPSLISLFSALVIPVIIAGSLMPPISALIVAGINCVLIVLVATLQSHTPAYDAMLKQGLASVSIALPITIQIIVSVVTYVIMRNLLTTIRRADRAEEIVALQSEIAEFERSHIQEQQQLEEGITMIAQVHSEIARGNLGARVPLGSENVLWQVAVPLNNLLNRVQQWKNGADQLERTQAVLHGAAQELQERRRLQQAPYFQQRTGTAVDPILVEINYLAEHATQKPQTFWPQRPHS